MSVRPEIDRVFRQLLANSEQKSIESTKVNCSSCKQEYPRYNVLAYGGICGTCYGQIPNQMEILPKDYIHRYTNQQIADLSKLSKVYTNSQDRAIYILECCSLAVDRSKMIKEWILLSQKTLEMECCRCLHSRNGSVLVGNIKTGNLLVMGVNCAERCGIISRWQVDAVRRERERERPTMVSYNT